MKEKIGVVSLGCSKNLVDTEYMMALLKQAGFSFTKDPESAEILIVNTCGFIQSAKEESIEQIFTLARHKQNRCHTLVVTGCLSERYRGELQKEMPEADIFLGVREYEKLPALLLERCGKAGGPAASGAVGRVLTTQHMAYLRISDGCDNRCSYCAIPMIRGPHAERPMQAVLDEARELADKGAKELCVIAQDTTRFGCHSDNGLGALLRKLDDVGGVKWIRVLYAYPAGLTDDIVSALTTCKKVVRYLDMPMQHANDEVLLRMNRRGGKAAIRRAANALRASDPDFVLRTSVMLGFPGETQAQFDELLTFMKEIRFDRVGAFTYSSEEGTPAAAMEGHIEAKIARSRLDMLMRMQQEISLTRQKMRVGRRFDVLVEGAQGEYFVGRSYAQAPEVDGKIYFRSRHAFAPGDWASVRLTRVDAYDSWGETDNESGQ